MSDWGKGVINNIGWGQGANNDIGWGSIYDKSNAGETLLKSDLNIDAFIIEVDTSKDGTPSDQFQFTGAEGDYDVIAKQNDIVVATFNDLSNQETITLPSSGVYDLEVKSKEVNGFNRIAFDNGGDRRKLTDIKQWGTIAWSSFGDAFYGCSNMLVTATDVPNLSVATSLANMFDSCDIVNPNVSNWNTGNIENMSRMFFNTGAANPNVSFWDVSNCSNFFRMFQISVANPNARNWNIVNATGMAFIFSSSEISSENLTACYENWSQLNLQQNVSFSAGTTKYNASGQAGRDILVNTYNWTLQDGGVV
jgi:hypothetical protein